MRRAPLSLVAALVVALAATAAGCGGGGGGGGKPLSKSEFIAKADGICSKANKDLPSIPKDLQGVDPTSASVTDKQLEEFGDYIENVVKNLRGELDDLRGVKPPANLQDDYDKALANLEEAINELGEAGDAAKKHDRAEFKAKLAESDTHSSAANDLARKLGLTVCGSS